VSGSRTYCLKGALALLETKLMAWALEKIADAGFTPITVPAIAREQAFLNQGQFPGHRGRDIRAAQRRFVAGRHRRGGADLAPFGRDHRGDKLPCSTPATRLLPREAGSAGKDVRGLLRVHQFVKVEHM
jgi:seryl-tRNA synthetase